MSSDNLNNKIVIKMEILSLHVHIKGFRRDILIYLELLCVLAIGILVTL